MKKLSLVLTAVVLLFASLASAQNCSQLIVDKAGVINNPGMIQNAARNLINQGADVHVVTIPRVAQYGPNLEAVETYIERACPSWTTNGVRKANLFVVMVAPNDRAKNIFLGSYYNGSFDVPTAYSNASNSYFKNRQWSEGLASVLNQTSGVALAFRRNQAAQQQAQRVVPVQPQTRTYTSTAPVYTSTPQQADSGISGFAIFMVVMFVMLALAVILYFVFRSSGETTNTTTYVTSEPSYTTRRYAASAPSHTTIINNTTPQYDSNGNLLTGVLIGEAIANNNRPVYVAPTPVVYDPAPSYIPDPTPAVVDQPDTAWEDPAPTQQADAQDTGWNDLAPSQDFSTPDPPSFDPPSSSDSGF
jgi:uncharacterized membrane protein YgcG